MVKKIGASFRRGGPAGGAGTPAAPLEPSLPPGVSGDLLLDLARETASPATEVFEVFPGTAATTDSFVDRWGDSTVSGNDFRQATAGERCVYRNNIFTTTGFCVNFSETPRFLDSAVTSLYDYERTDQFYVNIVFALQSLGTNMLMTRENFSGPARGWLFHTSGNDCIFQLRNEAATNALVVSAPGVTTNTKMMYSVRYLGDSDASTVEIRKNGVLQSTTIIQDNLTATTSTTNNATLGFRNGGNTSGPSATDALDGVMFAVQVRSPTVPSGQALVDLEAGILAAHGI